MRLAGPSAWNLAGERAVFRPGRHAGPTEPTLSFSVEYCLRWGFLIWSTLSSATEKPSLTLLALLACQRLTACPPRMELEASMEQSVQTRIFKIIVIGDSNVGKTCLTVRFCGGAFPVNTEATIGVDFREKAVEIEGEHIKVQVWDTAGQERFRKSMVEHYYRNVHAVVFVYDVTKMASFINLKTWIEECNGHAVPALVPKVLVGNKCDLRDQIQVPSSMALKFADAHNMLLFETSAKDPKESQNVESIFMCLACRLKAQKSLLYRDTEKQQGKAPRMTLMSNGSNKNACSC